MSRSRRRARNASPEKGAELGVLFIHGIGQQKRGDTLLEFGEPICRWLEASGAKVQVGKTQLGIDPDDPAAPAHADVSVSARGDFYDRTGRVLLAESCWAESFPTPTFREVARWALIALPWTLAMQFASRFEPAMGARGGLLRHYPRFALDTVRYVLVFLLGACVQLCVAGLLVLALVPIPKLRDLLLRLQVRIAGIIGDSYVLLDSPIRASAILSNVRGDLEWLVRRCRRVALVGHSQGAAVAHRLIERLEKEGEEGKALLDSVNLYFSFGSGLGKLHDIQEAFREGGATLWLGFILMLSVLVISAAVPLALLTTTGPNLLVGFLVLLAYCGFFAILLFLGMSSFRSRQSLLLTSFRKTNSGNQGEPQRSPSVRWVDRFATADPVSSGPLLPGEPDDIDSQPVRNRASFWSDHTTYWENRDEFVRMLVDELGSPFSSMYRSGVSLDEAVARRRWRTAWLSAFRIVGTAALMGALWGLWKHLAPLGDRVLSMLRLLLLHTGGERLIPDAITVLSTRSTAAIGAFGIALLALLWFRLVFVAWKRWEQRDFRRTVGKRGLDDEGGLPFLVFCSLGVLFPALVLILAFLDFDLNRMEQLVLDVWRVRASVGFGSVLVPLFSAMTAIVPWWLVTRADEKQHLDRGMRGETFITAWIVIGIGAFAATVWVGLHFPNALRALSRRASLWEQAWQALALWLPYVVVGGIVALFSRTVGPLLGEWLTSMSFRIPRHDQPAKVPPRSILAMGVISSVCGTSSFAARALFDRFGIGGWDLLALAPLWFVAGLAGMNALARDINDRPSGRESTESLGARLGGLGLLLASISLTYGLYEK